MQFSPRTVTQTSLPSGVKNAKRLYTSRIKDSIQGWNQLKDAGKRWTAEIIFSSIKRVLGEDLLSKKFCAQKV
ncbi:MAG: hypothetical protein WBE68_05055 [Candidatus Nitrosopolaris sp.]